MNANGSLRDFRYVLFATRRRRRKRRTEAGVKVIVFGAGDAGIALIARLLAKLPAAFVHAIRLALSDSLHDIYVFAGAILVFALISTVFMKEVPLSGDRAENGFDEEGAIVDEDLPAAAKVPA